MIRAGTLTGTQPSSACSFGSRARVLSAMTDDIPHG